MGITWDIIGIYSNNSVTGWWFGSLEHVLLLSILIGIFIIPTDFHIFQRG